MARALNLSFQDIQFKCGIKKVDRSKLYGYTSVDVKDDEGSSCGLATISEDGKHILSKGCVGYTTLNEQNEFVPTSDIRMMDLNGDPIEKIPSSFDLENIALEVSSIEEYLTINVKTVYQLEAEEGSAVADLLPVLEEHKILKCTFNYRADYDEDDAYIIHSGDTVFMILGAPSPFEFIGLEQQIEPVIEEDEDEDESFDFGAL